MSLLLVQCVFRIQKLNRKNIKEVNNNVGIKISSFIRIVCVNSIENVETCTKEVFLGLLYLHY